MKKTGIVLTFVLILAALLLNTSMVAAATDGYYNLSEASPAGWDGTGGSSLKPVSSDSDCAYGDDASVTYNLPWSFVYYGQSFNTITADTNGNIWFNATDAAYSFNLATTSRGPVISAWNNDLSSTFYGGVFIQHKTNPERIVIEWQSETYSEDKVDGTVVNKVSGDALDTLADGPHVVRVEATNAAGPHRQVSSLNQIIPRFSQCHPSGNA